MFPSVTRRQASGRGSSISPSKQTWLDPFVDEVDRYSIGRSVKSLLVESGPIFKASTSFELTLTGVSTSSWKGAFEVANFPVRS